MDGISGFTNQLRFTGLSGLDTESIIEQLMTAERVPLDTLKQKKTLLEWKQEAYRNISSLLIGFKSKFFDIVNRSSYMLSSNSITPKIATSSKSEYVTATATADAPVGEHKITVHQLATAAHSVSGDGISHSVTGSVTEGSLSELAGKQMIVSLDGVARMVAFDKDITITEDNLADELKKALDKAFGLKDNGDSKFDVNYDSENNILTVNTTEGSTRVTFGGFMDETSALGILGIENGSSNRINLNSTLETLSNQMPFNIDANGKVSFIINGKTIVADKNDTLKSVFERINNDEEINVKISYDEVTDKVTIQSKLTGAGNNLEIKDTGSNFFAALKMGPVNEGKDARVTIDGQTLIRNTNTISVNGINYTIHKAHSDETEEETISITQDVDTVVENIKTFIEEYNKLVDTINGKTNEKYDRNYMPLTDAQKKEMKEEDLKRWEEKAKTGLLRNDSLLERLTLTMRQALYENVEGVSITLKDIGISSRSYTDNGKLYLDEDALRKALQNKPDEVTKLLNGVSENVPNYSRDLTAGQRKERYDNSGVFRRLSDIIEDYVSTVRNADGQKGFLLEKAGIEGDLSNTKNQLYDQLKEFDKRIYRMTENLIRKEESYYKKFSQLETLLMRMNQQSAWIANQFATG